ncbi:MAG: penicillin-binding protein, partial [Bradyrhizobium sp.]|nr:penicillin-binding protein [Bradyrhizobium sp.]
MAWGRKKSGGRKEPLFGLAASLSELRLGPQDRVVNGDDEPKKRQSAKRKASDSGEDAPRERKPHAKGPSSKRKSGARARSGLGRLVYWGAVLGLWAVIAAVGIVIWVGAHLPAIQSLEIP